MDAAAKNTLAALTAMNASFKAMLAMPVAPVIGGSPPGLINLGMALAPFLQALGTHASEYDKLLKLVGELLGAKGASSTPVKLQLTGMIAINSSVKATLSMPVQPVIGGMPPMPINIGSALAPFLQALTTQVSEHEKLLKLVGELFGASGANKIQLKLQLKGMVGISSSVKAMFSMPVAPVLGGMPPMPIIVAPALAPILHALTTHMNDHEKLLKLLGEFLD